MFDGSLLSKPWYASRASVTICAVVPVQSPFRLGCTEKNIKNPTGAVKAKIIDTVKEISESVNLERS